MNGRSLDKGFADRRLRTWTTGLLVRDVCCGEGGMIRLKSRICAAVRIQWNILLRAWRRSKPKIPPAAGFVHHQTRRGLTAIFRNGGTIAEFTRHARRIHSVGTAGRSHKICISSSEMSGLGAMGPRRDAVA